MVTSQIHGVRKFLDERVKVDPLGIVPKEELYRKYYEYCKTHNHIPYTKWTFSAPLKKLLNASSEYSLSPPPAVSGVFDIATTRRTIDGSRTWCWAGIRLKEILEGEKG